MSDDQERSESGNPIHRYSEPADFELATGDSDNIDRIVAHIEHYLGPVDNVFHELISDQVHIDVHVLTPTEARPYYTLITSGMSDKPMAAPEGAEAWRYSELMICLPADWPMGEDAWKDDRNYWPIYMLKFLARFPHQYKTWLWTQHSVPNGDPASPFGANTQLCCAMLLPPLTVPDGFHTLRINDEKTIYFHAIIPLTKDEMEMKLKKGAEALYSGFEQHKISEILDAGRRSTVKRKRWWQR